MTPACASGLLRFHLRLLEYSLQLSPASSRRFPSVAGRPSVRFVRLPSSLGIPNHRPSVVSLDAVHSRLTDSHPSPCPRQNHANGSACSVLVVSHDLDGFLPLQACRLVASCFRPWGPSGFQRLLPETCTTSLPSAFQLSDRSVSLTKPVPAGLAHCLSSVPVLSDATTLRSFSRPRSRLLGHLRCSHFNEVRTTAPACRDVPVSRCTASSALPLFVRLASVPRPVSWLLLGRSPHSQQKLTTRHSQTDSQPLSVA